MKYLSAFLLFLALASTCQLNAQLIIPKNMDLSDSTQTHVVTVLNGDQLTGRILNFNQAQLQLLYFGNELVLPIAEIGSVRVKNPGVGSLNGEEGQENPTFPLANNDSIRQNPIFEYKMISLSGSAMVGKIDRVDKTGVYMREHLARVVPYNAIGEVIHTGRRISDGPFDATEIHELKTENGDLFLGQIIGYDGGQFTFLQRNGSELTFPKEDIKLILLRKVKAGMDRPAKFYYNQRRTFLAPSALMLEEGVNEFRTHLLYNTVDHGLSKHITVGAGAITLVTANGVSGKVKIGASLTDHIHLAAGLQGAAWHDMYEGFVSFGLLYGAATIGNNDRFISLSVGLGNTNNEMNDPTIGYGIGGSHRFNNKWRLYGEFLGFSYDDYYYARERISMGSLGLSWFKSRHQLDFGLGAGHDGYYPIVVPVVGYSLRF